LSRIVRISYGSFGSPAAPKTIDFPRFAYKMNPPDYDRKTLGSGSASGVVETLTVRTDVNVEIAFRHCLQREEPYITLKRNLKQWAGLAKGGSAWSLALDSTDTVLTRITNSPAAGESLVSLLDATGVVAGRSYVLRNEFDAEPVKVLSIAGLDMTLAEPLNYGYFADDRFRSEMYWPARLMDGSAKVILENGPLWFDVELRFTEDVNSL
jgi:hypothetical protein